MSSESDNETFSDAYLYKYIDAALPPWFEVDEIKFVEMQTRHAAYDLAATEYALKIAGLQMPLNLPGDYEVIHAAIEKLKGGEEFEYEETVPEAAFGVLWGWCIVSEFDWRWHAVASDWWETLAICDQNQQYFILPIQYIRKYVEGESPDLKSPRDYIELIRKDQLPNPNANQLVYLC